MIFVLKIGKQVQRPSKLLEVMNFGSHEGSIQIQISLSTAVCLPIHLHCLDLMNS